MANYFIPSEFRIDTILATEPLQDRFSCLHGYLRENAAWPSYTHVDFINVERVPSGMVRWEC
jgi:hypothetical protein